MTAAWTDADDGADLQSPWGKSPSYTSVQVEDFNRGGESAMLLRMAYDFSFAKGLSAYALWVNGTKPDAPGQVKEDEYDLSLQWKAPAGALKGLAIQSRYAYVTQDGGDDDDLRDFRVICSYALAFW